MQKHFKGVSIDTMLVNGILSQHKDSMAFSTNKNNVFSLDKTRLYWICQIVGWSLYGVYVATMSIISDDFDFTLNVLLDTIFTMLCMLTFSHYYRNYIIKKQWLRLLFAKLLFRISIASLVLSVCVLPFSVLSYLLFDPTKLQTSFSQENIIIHIISGTLLFFWWSLAYFLYHYVSSYNRNLKWEAMINEFELNKLRSQLNPHFIFNALNSVKALVDENPDKAKDSIYQLSNILRNSLLMDKKKVIPFEEELSIVKDYLSLESTRFEERLQLQFTIDPASLSYKVPPMMLQTLVENAIKHGIAKRKNGGFIHIDTEVTNEHMKCHIRNTGQYLPEHNRKGGYGIKSTLQRLELLYHKKASFSIQNINEDTVLVEVILPRWDESELVFTGA